MCNILEISNPVWGNILQYALLHLIQLSNASFFHICLLCITYTKASLTAWSYTNPISVYCQTSNISRSSVGNKIVDHWDVVGASPVGAAPTTSSFSTYHLASIYCTKTTASKRRRETFKFWDLVRLILTHWGRVTHICVGELTIIDSDNGLSPGRRQAIIWTNAGILLIGPLGTNFSEILIEIHAFSFKKMRLKVSSANWRPFCIGLNELRIRRYFCTCLPSRKDSAVGKLWEICFHVC